VSQSTTTPARPGRQERITLEPRPELATFSARAKAELARLMMRDRDQRMRRGPRSR
jgi:hypothetical protein